MQPPTSNRETLRQETLVARVLRDGFRWLRFPEPLEQQFRTEHLESSHRLARMGLLVATLTSAGFAVIDHTMLHGTPNAIPDAVRFGVQFPVVLLCLLATIPRFYVRWFEIAIQIGVPIFGIGTAVALSYSDPNSFALIGARLLLVAFYAYFMTGLRMRQALRSNAIIFLGIVWMALYSPVPSGISVYLGFAFVCANIIGGVGAYVLEHASRGAFLDRLTLQEMASRDGLTQLLNRQTFEWRATKYWQSTRSSAQAAAVLMIDVDYFKMYNDNYGHQAGDECLRRIAATVHAAIDARGDDLIGRYGGEELIVFAFDRDAAELQRIAQRIVADVQAMSIEHSASPASDKVSVSVGAALCQPPLSIEYGSLIRAADKALYAAKHQGRNRAVVLETRAAEIDNDIAPMPSSRPAARPHTAREPSPLIDSVSW